MREDLQAKQVELDAAQGGDADKTVAAAAQEEALAKVREEADKNLAALSDLEASSKSSTAEAAATLEAAAMREAQLESELAEAQSESTGSNAAAEAELRQQLSDAQAEAERRKREVEAIQAAHGSGADAGAFDELSEWKAVLAVEASLRALEEQTPTPEAVAVTVSEGGFADFHAFLAALKIHDCASPCPRPFAPRLVRLFSLACLTLPPSFCSLRVQGAGEQHHCGVRRRAVGRLLGALPRVRCARREAPRARQVTLTLLGCGWE